MIDDLYPVTSDSAMSSIVYYEIYIHYMGKIDHFYRIKSDPAMSSIVYDEVYIQYKDNINWSSLSNHIWLSDEQHYVWWNVHSVYG